MKRILSGELQMWHLLILVAILALATGGIVAAQGPGPQRQNEQKVSPETAEAFFPPGAFQMTAASKNDSVTLTGGAAYAEVIRATFTIPDGHRADIAAFFNGEVYQSSGGGYCYGEFVLDALGSTPLKPGVLWLTDGYVYNGAYPTVSMQAFRKGVPSGPHTLYFLMFASSSNCYLYDRSLNVFANMR